MGTQIPNPVGSGVHATTIEPVYAAVFGGGG
jgi:hypothetical protein